MKVLVTGGAGFLASHVADSLTEAGHEVIVFDVIPSPYLRTDQKQVVGSILDRDALLSAAKGCDVLYHFAAVADIGEASSDPVRTIEVNVMGTVNALEAARVLKVHRFVLASSIYVYSDQGSFYRTSKQACERLVEDYHESYGLDFTILRFGSLYGPRAGMTNGIYRLVHQALHEGRIAYAGSGTEVREYIHVNDGAAAAVEILRPDFENEIVHLTGHERMTTREMCEMIAEILGGGVKVELTGKGVQGHYVQTPYSYTPRLGRKLLRETYIDIGLGILDLVEFVDQGKRQGAEERQA